MIHAQMPLAGIGGQGVGSKRIEGRRKRLEVRYKVTVHRKGRGERREIKKKGKFLIIFLFYPLLVSVISALSVAN